MEPNVNTQKVDGEKPSLLGMITSPGLQFERMKASNKIWGIFFLVSFLQALVSGLSTYILQTSPETIAMQEKFGLEAEPIGTLIGKAVVQGFIGVMIGAFIVAAIYKIFMMFFGNDTSYKTLLAIITYSSIAMIIGGLINSVLSLVLDGGSVYYTSLSPLFEEGTIGYAIGNTVEVFYLWNLFLIWIGLQITAGLGKVKAAVPIVILFIIKAGFISLVAVVMTEIMKNI
ncbi:Yip1 family protein [Bacillus sp. DX4.1]|uniref:Yip1 family protein n=1 Tax=Bacillus sp. DX4.1 TaxID=3055867 RepID=UPI0025A235B1|nr:Yip1 family protein [Bacillus sp. DX4.1]MDM5190827.1 Yip1 family protein [Bacillus sp. DX4.1]